MWDGYLGITEGELDGKILLGGLLLISNGVEGCANNNGVCYTVYV